MSTASRNAARVCALGIFAFVAWCAAVWVQPQTRPFPPPGAPTPFGGFVPVSTSSGAGGTAP